MNSASHFSIQNEPGIVTQSTVWSEQLFVLSKSIIYQLKKSHMAPKCFILVGNGIRFVRNPAKN